MSYQPIENYGIIGDLHTIALVGLNGSIDFMCFPEFNSPSLFASLLDESKGGFFSINPGFKQMKCRQLYVPDTNVLLTRFLSPEGVGEITDFMPVSSGQDEGRTLVRRITTVRGEVRYTLQCRPRFDYGRIRHSARKTGPNEIVFTPGSDTLPGILLKSSVALDLDGDDVQVVFTLKAGQTADFLLQELPANPSPGHTGPSSEYADPSRTSQSLPPFSSDKSSGNEQPAEDFGASVTRLLFHTMNYWKDWVSRSLYKGRWMETVNRSALLLKLLTSGKYGSIIAAPTFGLPESIGGNRNWDYRFTWIRDASFTVYSFIRLGYIKEAGAFMNWVEKLCRDIKGQERLGIMYSIDGGRQLEEITLDNFEGYKKSSPVRIGNNAYGQLQLDIYGELMDSVYLYNKHGEPISYDFWKDLEKQMDWLSAHWNQPDDGIWEVRGGPKNFLYSRLSSWVALDRAIKIAEARSFPTNGHWREQRDKIYNSIYQDFWNEEKKAFMQFPGSETVDASSLLMPLLRFISPKDPRWLSSLKRIEEELVTDSLVYRYRPEIAAPDGFASREGTFSMCTFWYVECLSRSGQLEKARFYFEKMLGYANHLGLYSEQLGFEGEHLGNFPQAFTHLGLISAAHNLDKQLNDSHNRNIDMRSP